MRILGFSKKWDKLRQGEFTTFRFSRKDKDWQRGELAKVVYKPRGKDGKVLGVAHIIDKELRKFGITFPKYMISDDEARDDGFDGYIAMRDWFLDIYGKRILDEPMNKLTLRWVK